MPNHMPPLPFHEGYLLVDGGHRLYFAEYGQPNVHASLVVHGGPGSGCKPSMLEWFDLAQDRVILFDQRGAGRSLPPGETTSNQTGALVRDIEHLRQHLGLSRCMMIGGSWGATLALCYAGRFPEVLRGLILRGTFLASRNETTWFFQSLKVFAPSAWSTLTAGWTTLQKQNVLQTLIEMLHSVSWQEQQEAARRWGEYEEAVIQAMTGGNSALPVFDPAWVNKYRVQSHYLNNACFISQKSLFRSARHAAQIPTIILHGTHDWICPPMNAMRLMRFMPHAELRWIKKGTHTSSDPLIRDALRQAIRDFRYLE
jgi:proline iminopeptidase